MKNSTATYVSHQKQILTFILVLYSIVTYSQFNAVEQLSTLNGNNGFVLKGSISNSFSGNAVSTAGDINGDGIDDLIIGASMYESFPSGKHGVSYIVFGKGTAFQASITLDGLTSNEAIILDGEIGQKSVGDSVSLIGDFNGDGLDDIVVGDGELNNFKGAAHILFGSNNGFSLYTSNFITINDPSIHNVFGSNNGDFVGRYVSGLGDINNDGFDDLIVSGQGVDPFFLNDGSGAVYVVLGSSLGLGASGNLGLFNLFGANGFAIYGLNDDDSIGSSIGSADVNGDGINDMLIGARNAGSNGKVYVVLGSVTGFPVSGSSPSSFQLSTLNGSNGFVIEGGNFTGIGQSISGLGDVNGDGIDDIIVDGDSNSVAYVIFGKTTSFSSTINVSTLNGTNGFSIDGGGNVFLPVVAGAGDINGDGIKDIVIGDAGSSPNGSGSGTTYVIFGKATAFSNTLLLSNLNGSNGFEIQGPSADSQSGSAVNKAGDINNDGIDDLIIGAPHDNNHGGATYVVFGRYGGNTPKEQRDPLVALYESTNGINWANRTNWLVGDPCDDNWYGVTCVNNSVTEIDLSNNNLVGSIPRELGNALNKTTLNSKGDQQSKIIGELVSLQILRLRGNELVGDIPDELANLISLIELNLESNHLNGSIPPRLMELVNLQRLDLGDNQLTGPIPSGLGDLTGLLEMRLGSNHLTGPIPPQLGSLPNLIELNLGSNQLTGNIPPEIGNNTNLQKLRFDRNALSGHVPGSLISLINLQNGEVSFEYNALTFDNPGLQNLLDQLCSCSTDTTQTISPNNLFSIASSTSTISFNWNKIAYQRHGGYKVFVSNNSNGPFSQVYKSISKTVLAFTVGGLNSNQTYYFKIRSFTFPNLDNQNFINSVLSSVISVTTKPTNVGSVDPWVEILPKPGPIRVGEDIETDIVVGNNGPDNIVNANVKQEPPTGITGGLFTCTGSTGGAICPATKAAAGNLDVNVNLPANSSLTFTRTSQIATIDEASVILTATITPPDGYNDSQLSNNDPFINLEKIFGNDFEE